MLISIGSVERERGPQRALRYAGGYAGGLCGGRMTVAGAGKYKMYFCANAKEKGPSVCSGFRGLQDSIALPHVLSALRDDLMKPEHYETFRTSVEQRLKTGNERPKTCSRRTTNACASWRRSGAI